MADDEAYAQRCCQKFPKPVAGCIYLLTLILLYDEAELCDDIEADLEQDEETEEFDVTVDGSQSNNKV